MKKKTKIALLYDFDGTLAPGNMQDHDFLPKLGIKPKDFWAEVKQIAKEQDADEILVYLDLMLKKAKEKRVSIHQKTFQDYGKSILLFDWVEDWFDAINLYASSKWVVLEHYIISSGLREMIKWTKISKKFTRIFASSFMYDNDKIATWPGLAVNYTTKTQFLFRVNKGIDNCYDNSLINKYLPEEDRDIPFDHMIYLGDGETDIPAMKTVKMQWGYSIAVYNPKTRGSSKKKSQKDICAQLITEQRAGYMAAADYTDDSDLDKIVKAIIGKIIAEDVLRGMNK